MRNHLAVGVIALLAAGEASAADGDDRTVCHLEPSPRLPDTVDNRALHRNFPFPARVQNQADCYSWASFVALNWPAKPGRRGEPDTGVPFGTVGPAGVVWQGYWSPAELFRDEAADPCPRYRPAGTDKGPIPVDFLARCFQTGGTGTPGVDGIDTEILQAFTTSWLTDRDGNVVRYQIGLNQDFVHSVVHNRWYDAKEQAKAKAIALRAGNGIDMAGVLEVKAAWRVLTEKDASSRYFTMDTARVPDIRRDPATGQPVPQAGAVTGIFPTCTEDNAKPVWRTVCTRRMGLVGFHIGRKLDDLRQWVWSTFEHVDNAPTRRAGKVEAGSARYSFHDPDCREGAGRVKPCTANLPPYAPGGDQSGHPLSVPVQVVRDLPTGGGIERPADAVNRYWWDRMPPGSVWRNYMLVGTQWPSEPDQSELGEPFPATLSNATLETYLQTSPQGSCIGCHVQARTADGRKSADFSFILMMARSSAN